LHLHQYWKKKKQHCFCFHPKLLQKSHPIPEFVRPDQIGYGLHVLHGMDCWNEAEVLRMNAATVPDEDDADLLVAVVVVVVVVVAMSDVEEEKIGAGGAAVADSEILSHQDMSCQR
jgi:hypothetical protein